MSPARRQLVELAFDAAGAVPVQPHAKTRTRLQGDVIATCLECGDPDLAELLLRRCDDGWRKGLGYAELASVQAARGATAPALASLQLASRLADSVLQDDNPQQWRRDRVRAVVARVYHQLGRDAEASRYGEGLEPGAAAKLAQLSADQVTTATLPASLAGIDAVLQAGDFDQAQAALATCAGLYARFFDDPKVRGMLAERVRTAFPKLPLQARAELLSRLVTTAAARGDRTEAKAIFADLPLLLRRAQWLPADRLSWAAQLAVLRHRTGATAEAVADLEAAASEVAASTGLEDHVRADVERSIAVAWAEFGDADRAARAFGQAIASGGRNPNARPRADDLVASCLALARWDIAPDAATQELLAQLRRGLRDPW